MYRNRSEQLFRLVLTILVLLYVCFRIAPVQTFVIISTVISAYFVYRRYIRYYKVDEGRRNRRKTALYAARAFLNKYDNLWANLKLSNSYCSLTLIDENTIIGTEKSTNKSSYRSFKVIASKVHPWEEVWNMFCKNFSYNKSYDGLIQDCRLYELVITEKVVGISNSATIVNSSNEQLIEVKPDKLIDINNCPEQDLTDLPGISAIMAKKVIKKREEIYGFKSIDEFFNFLKLKEHQQKQLRDKICAKQIEGIHKIEISNERQVDL